MLRYFYSFLVYSSLDTTVALLWDTTVTFAKKTFPSYAVIDTEGQLIAANSRITGENILSKGNTLNDQWLQFNACLQIKHSRIFFNNLHSSWRTSNLQRWKGKYSLNPYQVPNLSIFASLAQTANACHTGGQCCGEIWYDCWDAVCDENWTDINRATQCSDEIKPASALLLFQAWVQDCWIDFYLLLVTTSHFSG